MVAYTSLTDLAHGIEVYALANQNQVSTARRKSRCAASVCIIIAVLLGSFPYQHWYLYMCVANITFNNHCKLAANPKQLHVNSGLLLLGALSEQAPAHCRSGP